MTVIARSASLNAPPLDPRERHFRVPSNHDGLSLFLRYMPARAAMPSRGAVLYVHGGTFGSALSIAHRIDGRSWRDELCSAGFDVWGLDFHGFGRLSDPLPEMAEPADRHAPLGRAEDASRQLGQAVHFICGFHRVAQVSIIAHSWGTIVAGRFAGHFPEFVERMVFFGPIARREPSEAARLPAWRLITLKDQWDRFMADVPAGEPAVLAKRHFDEWGERYLDSDPQSRSRSPAAVKTPSGAFQDIFDAWAGDLAYDPSAVACPVAIIRGEWDGMCTDRDAAWLNAALRRAPIRRDIKVSRGTHLMHLESSRYALYREAETFLCGLDAAPDANGGTDSEEEQTQCSP
jgi:pimeloyl-ACP methyl ester carboxylesterase